MENAKLSLKEEVEIFKERSECKNCPKTRNVEKPYKMVEKELTPLTKKILNQVKELYGIEPSCFVCMSIVNFCKLPQEKRLEKLKELAKYR
jgi:hypothetical protein